MCSDNEVCVNNAPLGQYCECQPQCEGKDFGESDGCGGNCHSEPGEACDWVVSQCGTPFLPSLCDIVLGECEIEMALIVSQYGCASDLTCPDLNLPANDYLPLLCSAVDYCGVYFPALVLTSSDICSECMPPS